MANNKPRILVHRFAPHAQRLADKLQQLGLFAVPQPLLAVRESQHFANAQQVFTNQYEIIIAVSPNAVHFTQQALAGQAWPKADYFAVGKGTQKALHNATKQRVIIPQQCFTSEGVLALSDLADLAQKKVLIIRGHHGRELLRETLTQRGAKVEYYEPYQRVEIDLDGKHLVKQWQKQALNSAIISSIEIFERLLHLVPVAEQHWLKQLVIYAPSERILKHVRKAGFPFVDLLPGMSDQQICEYLQTK